MSKGKPIPVRFESEEDAAIKKIAEETGLDNSEVIRRSVRLLAREVEAHGVGFVFSKLAKIGRLAPKKPEGAARTVPASAQSSPSTHLLNDAPAVQYAATAPEKKSRVKKSGAKKEHRGHLHPRL